MYFKLIGRITKTYPAAEGEHTKITVQPDVEKGHGPRDAAKERVAAVDIWCDNELLNGLPLSAQVQVEGHWYVGTPPGGLIVEATGRKFWPRDVRMRATRVVNAATATVVGTKG